MLNIFKNYAAKTSILDDFDFYENREKVMVQKKLRFPPALKVMRFSSLSRNRPLLDLYIVC